MANNNSNWMNEVTNIDFTDPSIVHDRVLIVEDTKFYVQSKYLSVQSEFLATMFNSSFKEANENEIKLADVYFNVFLKECYPGNHELTTWNCLSVLELACRYLARGVLDRCMAFIWENIDRFGKMDLLEWAVKLSLDDFKEKVVDLITRDRPVSTYSCTACGSDQFVVKCGRNNDEHNMIVVTDGYTINRHCFFAKFYDRFVALPDSVQAYVFRKLFHNNN